MPTNNFYYTEKFLEGYEPIVVKQMQDILTKRNRNATHRLYNSFQMETDTVQNGFVVKMTYADHGKYVLDNDRTRMTKGPSYNPDNPMDPNTAIGALMNWILDKGISVGGGRIRTPKRISTVVKVKGRKQAYVNVEKLQARTEAGRKTRPEKKNPYPELTSMAFGIYNNIKKRGRTSAPSTNFLSPFNNLMRTTTFRRGLVQALKQDGIQMLQKEIEKGNNLIKIKM